MAEISVTGDRELDRKLGRLRQRVQTKLKKAAVRSALGVAAKEIKKNVPSRFKNVRRSIGWRLGKDKRYVLAAKVGWRIGKTARKAIDKGNRTSKKGVGIGARNFHWIELGAGVDTGGRYTKAGKYTGIMAAKKTDAVPRGWAASESKVVATMAGSLKRGIEREAAKQ